MKAGSPKGLGLPTMLILLAGLLRRGRTTRLAEGERPLQKRGEDDHSFDNLSRHQSDR